MCTVSAYGGRSRHQDGGPARPLISRGVVRARSSLLALICMAATAPGPGAAQTPGAPPEPGLTGSLAGVIVNARTRLPVQGAVIRVEGETRTATTGPDGYFELDELDAGDRSLEISIRGRVTPPQFVEVEPQRRIRIRVVIQVPEEPRLEDAAIIDLPPLEVEITRSDGLGKLRSYYRRMLSGRGRFLTREDVERLAPERTTDILRTVLGIEIIERGRGAVVRSNRGCVLPVFVDGLFTRDLSPDEIRAHDIDGIEIYRSASETPAIFRRSEGCGALVIWTRDPGSA